MVGKCWGEKVLGWESGGVTPAEYGGKLYSEEEIKPSRSTFPLSEKE